MKKLTLHPVDGGQPIDIETSPVQVGRDVTADLCLQDSSVSRRHADIENRGGEWFIFDLGSANGIWIEGEAVPSAKLTYGVLLTIGRVGFRVEVEGGNENATIVLNRRPAFNRDVDETMVGEPQLPARPQIVVPSSRPKRRDAPRSSDTLGTITAVTVAIALVLGGIEAYTTFANRQERPVADPGEAETVPSPEQSAATPATAPPKAVAEGKAAILVSTDLPAAVSVDAQKAIRLDASGLKHFEVTPGDHVVRYRGEGWEAEVVARVKAGEQKLVKPSDDPAMAGGQARNPTIP